MILALGVTKPSDSDDVVLQTCKRSWVRFPQSPVFVFFSPPPPRAVVFFASPRSVFAPLVKVNTEHPLFRLMPPAIPYC